MKNLLELLSGGEVLVADGAMATSLYERGYYINRSFEELSLTDSHAVRQVTMDFQSAGAQILHTNTFNATRPKLTKYGLQDQLQAILRRSAQIAKEVAGESGYALGLIGPLGVLVEPLGPTSLIEAEDHFAEIAEGLESGGVDGFAINAHHDLNELSSAIVAVRKISKKPLFVSIGLNESLRTSYGHKLEDLVELADKFDLSGIGICGEIGPSTTLTAIEKLVGLTNRPVIALPNAGLPRYVNDQYIYLCNPDYLGKFAKRFVQAGAKVVGGHSGVYENHIRAISNAVKMVKSAAETNVSGRSKLPSHIKPIVDQPLSQKPLQERSILGEHLATGKKIISVELVAPSLHDFSKFIEHCQVLENANIKFINIPDGARAMARMSSIHLSSYVQRNFKLETIPHFTCRDRNLIGLQSDLLGAHISEIRNLLLVTGDPPKLGNNPGASAVYDVDAIGLTHIVSRMNRGLDMGGASTQQQSEFVIGVALNPTAKNQESEVSRFKFKKEAGCDFAITQPIYNVQAFEKFIEESKVTGVPIIMGIWPLVSLRNAEFLKYEVPGVDVPDWVIDEMQKAGDSKEDALKVGMEIAIRTIEEAKSLVAGFQISAPFNKSKFAIEVLRGAGLIVS